MYGQHNSAQFISQFGTINTFMPTNKLAISRNIINFSM